LCELWSVTALSSAKFSAFILEYFELYFNIVLFLWLKVIEMQPEAKCKVNKLQAESDILPNEAMKYLMVFSGRRN